MTYTKEDLVSDLCDDYLSVLFEHGDFEDIDVLTGEEITERYGKFTRTLLDDKLLIPSADLD